MVHGLPEPEKFTRITREKPSPKVYKGLRRFFRRRARSCALTSHAAGDDFVLYIGRLKRGTLGLSTAQMSSYFCTSTEALHCELELWICTCLETNGIMLMFRDM